MHSQKARHPNLCRCEYCESNRPFKVPEHLLEQLNSKNVIIFAGAGVSTESKKVYKTTLYEDILDELQLPKNGRLSFPEVFSAKYNAPDGRRKLLERIHNRISYVCSFPELYKLATSFHQELSTLFLIDTIFTTNWDDFFEQECGAIPFVTDEDFGFWNVCGRKVFKLHGSISNAGSIIATKEDYRKAKRRLERGAIGATLKHILSTKTVLYVGYSFTDEDFLQIHQYITKTIGPSGLTSYIVTLDNDSAKRFQNHGLIPIFTDATFFIQTLKNALSKSNHFIPDDRFNSINEALFKLIRIHTSFTSKIRHHDFPESIFVNVYQDGLRHSFDRILSMKKHGQYSHRCEVVEQIGSYAVLQKDALRRRNYIDYAYIEGYINGLYYLLGDNKMRKVLPYFFSFGTHIDIQSIQDYVKNYKKIRTAHKSSSNFARRLVRTLHPESVVHHPPLL